jgi:thioesterase domain-containing protein
MAHAYVAEIVARSPHGPYFLGGHCLGGAVALEIALELEARGATVARLVVLDSIAPPVAGDERLYVDGSPEKLGEAARQLRRILEDVIERTVSASPMLESDTYRRLGEVLRVHTEAAFAYRARPLRASLHVLRTEAMHDVVLENWSRIATAGIARHRVPGDTFSMLRPPHVEAVGRSLGRALEDLA